MQRTKLELNKYNYNTYSIGKIITNCTACSLGRCAQVVNILTHLTRAPTNIVATTSHPCHRRYVLSMSIRLQCCGALRWDDWGHCGPLLDLPGLRHTSKPGGEMRLNSRSHILNIRQEGISCSVCVYLLWERALNYHPYSQIVSLSVTN